MAENFSQFGGDALASLPASGPGPGYFDPSGMLSRRVRFPRATIRPSTTPDDPARTFAPLVAVQLVSDEYAAACEGIVYTVNDGMARVSFWLLALFNNGLDATPPPFRLQIRAGVSCDTSRIYEATVTPATLALPTGGPWSGNGLLVQTAGLLAQRYEIWAASAQGANQYDIKIEAVLDRLDAPARFINGPGTVQSFP